MHNHLLINYHFNLTRFFILRLKCEVYLFMKLFQSFISVKLSFKIIGNVIVLVIMQTKSYFICWFLNIKLGEVIYVSQHILTIPW